MSRFDIPDELIKRIVDTRSLADFNDVFLELLISVASLPDDDYIGRIRYLHWITTACYYAMELIESGVPESEIQRLWVSGSLEVANRRSIDGVWEFMEEIARKDQSEV